MKGNLTINKQQWKQNKAKISGKDMAITSQNLQNDHSNSNYVQIHTHKFFKQEKQQFSYGKSMWITALGNK